MTPRELHARLAQYFEANEMPEFAKEQDEMQPFIERQVSDFLNYNEANNYTCLISVGGSGRPSMDAFGTTFWPDLVISEDDTPVLAIEAKLAKKSFATALSSTIGQCFLYTAKYPHVIGLIKNQAPLNPKHCTYDQKINDLLSENNIPLIIK